MNYQKSNLFFYRLTQFLAFLLSKLVFRCRFLRNEIRGKKGGFVVIANHQAALDFVNLIGATNRRMTFVISQSFYSTLPIQGILNKVGVIPKQQFQTSIKDLKQMKAVVDAEQPLVLYPAGLMCADGCSTPIPTATYKFLKWLKTDVYVARTTGAYFVTPKWGKGVRIGRTTVDIYRLFSKEELAAATEEQVKNKAEQALLFDAYHEQEINQVPYHKGDCIAGLENVLYQCPHCQKEFSIQHKNRNILFCSHCSYAVSSDRFGFLHRISPHGEEFRYVSDWSRWICASLTEQINAETTPFLSCETAIHIIDPKRHRFSKAGQGNLILKREGFTLKGEIQDQPIDLFVSIHNIPSLPFSPGQYLELQHGNEIYRCVLTNGKMVMKMIHLLKIFSIAKNKTDAFISR